MGAVLAWAGVVLCVAAGVGWLYLLRDLAVLDLGPRIAGALPLQQLAGGEAQPLLRLVVAWVPAGWVAGALLARATRLSRGRRALGVALVAAAMLVVGGAVSDAAAISASVPSHLPAQLSRTATWVAVALMAAGSVPSRAGAGAS